jgi:hypothetical protein
MSVNAPEYPAMVGGDQCRTESGARELWNQGNVEKKVNSVADPIMKAM